MDTIFVEPPITSVVNDQWQERCTVKEVSSGGCRKVRWSIAGSGKRGGARIIYYNRLVNGEIWLLVIYTKSITVNIPAHILKSIREAIEHE